MVSPTHESVYQEVDLSVLVEINDFGYPQNSEIDTLKSYITTESIMSTSIAAVRQTVGAGRIIVINGLFRRSLRKSPYKLLDQRAGVAVMSSIRRTKLSSMLLKPSI